MTQQEEFRWHAQARLFLGVLAVPPPPRGDATFHTIPAQPGHAALNGLAHALMSGGRFCIAQPSLGPDLQAAPGEFFTLTGGSTGTAKIIRRTQASWIASFEVNAGLFDLTPYDQVAVLGSLSHSLALYGVLEGLHLGLDVHVLEGHRPKSQAALMAARDVSVLYATPTQLRLLARADVPFPNMRVILCGGGVLDETTRHQMQCLCPNARLHTFYGAAETSFVTITRKGSNNGHPYPGVEVQIEGTAEADGVGEVWVRSPYLFKGYADTHAPDAAWRDGFVSVGEMGQIMPSGALRIVGRKSRMVNVADQKVFPEVVEAFIATLPDVHANVVISLPDTLRGQRLIAVIEADHADRTCPAVHAACRRHFTGPETPAKVLGIPELPLLPSGKPDLRAVATWVEAHL